MIRNTTLTVASRMLPPSGTHTHTHVHMVSRTKATSRCVGAPPEACRRGNEARRQGRGFKPQDCENKSAFVFFVSFGSTPCSGSVLTGTATETPSWNPSSPDPQTPGLNSQTGASRPVGRTSSTWCRGGYSALDCRGLQFFFVFSLTN